MTDKPTKKCNCGRNMKLSTDQSLGLYRFWCEFCRRTVATPAYGDNERTRTQFGLGMKRTKWT